MRKFSVKKAVTVGAAAVIVASGAGVAFAYWTSTGTGTGTATTGTSSNFDVTLDSVNLADLTPGGPSDTITFHVSNPSTGVQYVTATAAKVVDTSKAGCTAADFTVSPTTFTNGEMAASGARDGSFTVAMINRTGVNQDACKGATVNLQVDVS